MRLLIATYPAQNKARMTATARNATGMPVRPVTAYAVGITPAHTVIGAMLAQMNASTDGMPSRSRASARDTVPARAAGVVLDIGKSLLLGVGVGGSRAAGKDGAVSGGLRLGDQLPQVRRELPGCLRDAAAGGQVLLDPEPQPAGGSQAGEHRVVG